MESILIYYKDNDHDADADENEDEDLDNVRKCL